MSIYMDVLVYFGVRGYRQICMCCRLSDVETCLLLVSEFLKTSHSALRAARATPPCSIPLEL
jgi:hypothetical protein